MTHTTEAQDHLAAAAVAMENLPLAEQRRQVLYLLEELDRQAPSRDAFAAMLLELITDIRQRIAMGQW